jgi:prolyl oligopeptidase
MRGRFIALVLAAAPAAGLSSEPPPAAVARPVQDTYFGVTVDDPFRYFENRDDPEVRAWMRAQADYTRSVLDRIPGRARLAERITTLDDAVAARVLEVQRRPGDLYFYEKRGAADNQFKLYMRKGLNGAERLLVDPEAIGKKAGKPHAINYYTASHDGRLLAYGMSAGGSEMAEIRVIETASGTQVMGPISRARYGGIAWLPDDSGFFFTRQQQMKPGMTEVERDQKLRSLFVRLGADVDKAPTVLAFDTPGVSIKEGGESPYVFPLPGTRWAAGYVAHGTDRELSLYVAPLADVTAGRAKWRKVIDRGDDVTGFEVIGDRLFLLTHKNAPRFRIIETSLIEPDLASAQVVMAEGAGVITGLVRAADGLYVSRRDGTVSRLFHIGTAKDAQPVEVKLPLAGSFEFAGVDHRIAGVLLTLQSWIRAPQIYRVAGAAERFAVSNTQLQPRGPYDALDDYVATEVLVPSHDGAQVPLSIIHKKGIELDGRNPTLLYGYASYGITEEPWFSLWRLAWLERGAVFAVANPRGSGAFGQDWYLAGKQATKPNTWKDFIATAEYLVRQGYTSPAKLGIWGGSAGGILVGRAMTERPDLFAAVVDSVGVSDTVRGELTPNGVANIAEFGTNKTEEGFRALLEMSTYHHIRDGVKYPAVLLTHGVNDPRVEVWESTKLAARLQQATASGKPVLLRLDYDSGHGVGTTKTQRNAERADILSFLLWQFGEPDFQPGKNASRADKGAPAKH